jgi:membrane-bound serine protease (ClpP class)
MVGEHGVARTELAPDGSVFVHGELWAATSAAPLAAGTAVVVKAVHGLRLDVEAAGETSPPHSGQPPPQEVVSSPP